MGSALGCGGERLPAAPRGASSLTIACRRRLTAYAPASLRLLPAPEAQRSAAPEQGQSVSKKEITMRLYSVGLIATLALAVLVASLAAHAQPPGKVFRVGVLLPLSLTPTLPGPQPQLFQAFQQRLQELGYVEGQNLALEVRAAE